MTDSYLWELNPHMKTKGYPNRGGGGGGGGEGDQYIQFVRVLYCKLPLGFREYGIN